MAEKPMPFSELLAGYGTTTIGEGMAIESVFALLKVRAEDGSAAWSVRSGGVQLTGEELLGVLDALTTSLRQRLTRAWKGTLNPKAPAASTGEHRPPAPIPFSELLAGLAGPFQQFVSLRRIEVVRPSSTPSSSSTVSGAPPLRTDHAAVPFSARTLSSANTDSMAIPSPMVVVP